jgi:hypothetical protein
MKWPSAIVGTSPKTPVVQVCAAKSGADHQTAPTRVPRRSRRRRCFRPLAFCALFPHAVPHRLLNGWPGRMGTVIPVKEPLVPPHNRLPPPMGPWRGHQRLGDRAKFLFRQCGQRLHRLILAEAEAERVVRQGGQQHDLIQAQQAAPFLLRHGGADHRTGLVRGNILPPPTAPRRPVLDSAGSQRHRARYLPEPQLIEQLLAELEPKEAGQELPAKRRVEQQVSAGRIHPLNICVYNWHRPSPFSTWLTSASRDRRRR